MTGLNNINSSFILLSSSRVEEMVSILYAKEYQVLPIKGYYMNKYENCAMSYGVLDNDDLRRDVIFLLNHFHEDSAIIKYTNESVVKKIFRDGSEIPMDIIMYNTDSNNISYLYNGTSFSFVESKRYWKPTKKEDFRVGMLVEYFNKDKWYERKVENPNEEYEKLYRLLIKYDKVRVASK